MERIHRSADASKQRRAAPSTIKKTLSSSADTVQRLPDAHGGSVALDDWLRTGLAGESAVPDSTRIRPSTRGAGGEKNVIRRLVAGSELKDDLGGPSSGSKTYRSLITSLDSYATVMNNPLPARDAASLLKDAPRIDRLVKSIIDTCQLFLDGHKKDKRAPRVAEIKADASRERAALQMRTNELKRGVPPTWASWREAIGADTTSRDLSVKATSGAKDAGAMNEVTAFSFGDRLKIGERGTRERGFFKADKANVDQGIEAEHAIEMGIPLGATFDDRGIDHKLRPAGQVSERDRSGPRFANRSVASYRIDQLLNSNVIAKTQFAVRNTPDGPVHGQLMEKAKGKKLSKDLRGRGDLSDPGSTADDPVVRRMLSKLDLVDSLCGQIDRHGGNVFVDRDKEGKVTSVTGIDNDLAFGTENFTPGETNKYTTEYAGIGKYIDEETGEAVLKLTERDLHAALDDLLLPDEIDAAIERLKTTQQIIQKAKQEGRLIGPDGWGDKAIETGHQRATKAAVGYHATLFHGADDVDI